MGKPGNKAEGAAGQEKSQLIAMMVGFGSTDITAVIVGYYQQSERRYGMTYMAATWKTQTLRQR